MEPEFGQRRENDGIISPTLAGKESGYVLNEEPSTGSYKLICDAHELEEEAASLATETGSPTGDTEVLAGESSTEEVNSGDFVPLGLVNAFSGSCSSQFSMIDPSGMSVRLGSNARHVGIAGDSGEAGGEDASAPLIRLALEDDSVTGSFKAEVDAADPREEAADLKHNHHPTTRRVAVAG